MTLTIKKPNYKKQNYLQPFIKSIISNNAQIHIKNSITTTINKHNLTFTKIHNIFNSLENKIEIKDIIIEPINLNTLFPTKRKILELLNLKECNETFLKTINSNELELFLINNPDILNHIEALFYNKKMPSSITSLYPDIYKYSLEMSQFMSIQIQECIHSSINSKIIIHFKFQNNQNTGSLEIYNTHKNKMSKNRIKHLAMSIIKRICFFNEILNVDRLPVFRIYMCPKIKLLPENNIFTPNNVNTAATDGTTILIWRNEELLKSILHESIHFHNLDNRNMNEDFINTIINNYSIKNNNKQILVFEAYTEALAEILNVIFFSDNSKTDLIQNIIDNMILEFEFGFFQMCKLLSHIKISKWLDFCNNHQTTPPQHKLLETTSTFCYFILKTQLLWNYEIMMNNLFKFNNKNDINIKCSDECIKVYNKLWISIMKNKIFINSVNDTLKNLKNVNKTKLKQYDTIIQSLRMTISDIYLL